ncbi:hypothetical protein BDN70DRAFT_121406 [Pholiota conissans]|uniref:Uncharacterized protein n=1 Tax=Pholiota conissans TaxID=109636 RepID=A0A9P5ZEI6_9AGAR|nr:hypothetical protein BDN70DRAFT_121406 [Pholiota conissans]
MRSQSSNSSDWEADVCFRSGVSKTLETICSHALRLELFLPFKSRTFFRKHLFSSVDTQRSEILGSMFAC